MTGVFYLWLGGAMVVFLTASAGLRAYVGGAAWPVLLGAILLYTIGNLMMVRLMRESGMAVAISVSAILQLVLANLVAVALFAERPGALQWLGIALGVVAVALIVWPQGMK